MIGTETGKIVAFDLNTTDSAKCLFSDDHECNKNVKAVRKPWSLH